MLRMTRGSATGWEVNDGKDFAPPSVDDQKRVMVSDRSDEVRYQSGFGRDSIGERSAHAAGGSYLADISWHHDPKCVDR